MIRKTTALFLAGAVLLAFGAAGADYFWTGAAGTDPVEKCRLINTPGNWVLADGSVPTAEPGHSDTLIFDGDRDYGNLYFTSTNQNDEAPVYAAFVLKGMTTSVRINALTNAAAPNLSFWFPPVASNETVSGTLSFGNRDVKMLNRVSGTNLFYVANLKAQIVNMHHMQNALNGVVLKRGQGTLRPYSGHNYDTRNYTLEGGTIYFPGHKQRDWHRCALVFSGDDPSCTFSFNFENYTSAYNGQPGPAWNDYAFTVPLREEGVSNSEHTLTSANGATVAYTGTVSDVTFTGRVRGSLCLRWNPADGTKTFTCAKGRSDTAGGLSVQNGTFALADGACFSSLTGVTVSAGATLNIAVGTVLRTAAATIHGATLPDGVYRASEIAGCTGDGLLMVNRSLELTVPYVAETKTATPLNLTAQSCWTAVDLAALGGVPFALSEAITITNGTLHATNRFLVARFAADSGLTPDLFRDVSPKTCDLPVTWFETEVADSALNLYLVARPVVSSLTFGTKDDLPSYYLSSAVTLADGTVTNMWSDGRLPHAGADYYCNVVTKNDTAGPDYRFVYDAASADADVVFAGETVTLDRCRFYLRNDFSANMRFYHSTCGNDDLFMMSRNGTRTVGGTIYVDRSCDDNWGIRGAGSASAVLRLVAPVTAEKNFSYRNTWSTSVANPFIGAADLSGVQGIVCIMGGIRTDTKVWQEVFVTITNKNALGGAYTGASTFGVRFSGAPKLIVAETMTFDTPGRAWYSSSSGVRLEVAEGKTFSLWQPYYSYCTPDAAWIEIVGNHCGLEKTGAGLFALGAPIIPCNSSANGISGNGTNNLVCVKEGGVMPFTADAFDRVALAFSDGTAIHVDPTRRETRPNGLRVPACVPAFDAGATVELVAETTPATHAAFTMAFLTVPEATPDLRPVLRPRPLVTADGMRLLGHLSSAPVTVNGAACTCYSVTYRASGVMVIVR